LHELATPLFFESSALFLTLLQRALPEVPPAVLASRAVFTIELLMNVVGGVVRLAGGAQAPLDPVWVEDLGSRLVDFVVGGLSAPVSRRSVRRPSTRTVSPAGAFWGLAGPTETTS
jgi:hypothetical protein